MVHVAAVKKFRRKQAAVEAVRWFKHGDHPLVVPFNTVTHVDQGWVANAGGKGGRVFPGDWIVLEGSKVEVYSDEDFKGTFFPLVEDDVFSGVRDLVAIAAARQAEGNIKETVEALQMLQVELVRLYWGNVATLKNTGESTNG